jgi:hypothetical protein
MFMFNIFCLFRIKDWALKTFPDSKHPFKINQIMFFDNVADVVNVQVNILIYNINFKFCTYVIINYRLGRLSQNT